jgi:membrane protease YdiL (CAAX protease family)
LIAGLATYLLFGEIYAFTGDMSPAVASTPMGIAQFPGTLPGALLEELLYRALLLTAMLLAWGHTKRGVIKSVVLSSFLFGATHLINIILRPVGVVVLQAILVSLPGVLYAALLLKSGSLWPAIVIHWLTNAAVNIKVVGLENYQETNVMWLRFALLLIPTTAYSAYVLWKLPIVKAEESSTQNRPPIGTVEPTESII